MKFKIKKNEDGQYYFEYVSTNGRVICWSESYHNKKDAFAAVELVRNGALGAEVEDWS